MADILNRVLSGHINLEDLLNWLKSDVSVSTELSLAKKSEFVPIFMKYIKESCSWILLINVPASGESVSKQNVTHSKHKDYNLGHQEKIFQKETNSNRSFSNKYKNSVTNTKNPATDIHPPDIYNLESFPPIDSKSQEIKTKRRIAPTPIPVASRQSLKFGHSGFATFPTNITNDIFKKTPYVESFDKNLVKEREMLKLTKNMFQSSSSSRNNIVSQEKKNVSSLKKIVQYIVPNPVLICHKEIISAIAEIYSLLLSHNLVPNVTTELYFIFKLLTAKITYQDKPSEGNPFCSIHNCAYFAISVLDKQQHFLEVLDNITLSTLKEIPFLYKFSPELVVFLEAFSSVKIDKTMNLPASHCVPFLLENDSRHNFPDDKSFVNFKKQRDLFFELLREWQQLSLSYAGSKFYDRFSSKARLLVNLNSSSTNLYHLAVLFQSQLISSCLCVELNETCNTLLNETQKNFPGRLEKLHERFIMPFCLGTPNPLPKFYGVQNFFCELIKAASSSAFNQHLLDVLITKILELNEADIFSDELSLTDTVKQKYVFLLHTVRLLGKFLGYITFLPYQDDTFSENIIKCDLLPRRHVTFPLNIPDILEASIHQGRVILTVPWVVEYLSMIDLASKHHDEIKKSFKILRFIHENEALVPQPYSFLFLNLLIGWLFDVLQFQEIYLADFFISSECQEVTRMDSLQLIDKQIIHSCCPYLVEFRVLICNYIDCVRNKNRTVKKITPVSSTNMLSSTLKTNQKVQKQLEETFFFFNPSLKEAVEFVAEILTLNFVKKIQSEVKDLKLECVKNISLDEKYLTISNFDPLLHPKIIDELIETHVSQSFTKLNSLEFIANNCERDMNKILPLLLLDDTKPQVLEMCCQLSFHRTMNMIKEWWVAKLNFDAIKCDIRNKVVNCILNV